MLLNFGKKRVKNIVTNVTVISKTMNVVFFVAVNLFLLKIIKKQFVTLSF